MLSAEERRREERNRREQSRSNKIALQIETLRELLFTAGYGDHSAGKAATNKHNVLAAAADYIRQLKQRNADAHAALNAPLPPLAYPPPRSMGDAAAAAAHAARASPAAAAAAAVSVSPGAAAGWPVAAASLWPSGSPSEKPHQRKPAVVEPSEQPMATRPSSRPQDKGGSAVLPSGSKGGLGDEDYSQVFATSAVRAIEV